ncbi:MAG TPA: nuclear transport factor 2 family protein [Candidatus Dormibacteraeota bacterium]|nr:nuclear transport factor 2 family protein [Candidatus Dormibacteraeota bacterium]
MRRVLIALFMVLVVAFAARIMMTPRSVAQQGTISPTEQQSLERDVRALLQAQAAAWNRGDIAEFMNGYWRSPQTVFAGSSGVQRGWDALLERYKRNYPDRAAMGHLTFSELEITPLGPDAAVILGHWHLQRDKDAPGGVFTLVARRFPEGWRIIHDHTSAVAAPPMR